MPLINCAESSGNALFDGFFIFKAKLFFAVMTWICLFTACLEFGAKENIIDTSEMISSEDGYFTGQFIPDYDPPISGKNTLEFILADEDGFPVVGALVTVTPFMPSMGHGSTQDPVVEEKEDGKYVATNIVYTMKGEWRLTVDVETESADDSFILFYEVE